MTQTTNRFFDEVARLMNDAAGVAAGRAARVRHPVPHPGRALLRDLDVVKREEFEAVKDMARLAREENEALKARIAALEAKLGGAASRRRRRQPAPRRAAVAATGCAPAIAPISLSFRRPGRYKPARAAAPTPLEARRGANSYSHLQQGL